MSQNEEDKFKVLLDATHTWPADYPFRFIVPKIALQDFLKLFPQILVHQERPSANGKYSSVSFHLRLNSSSEVMDIYNKARSFPGVIAL
jgi:putative lipoic acid-binding regulatory protein